MKGGKWSAKRGITRRQNAADHIRRVIPAFGLHYRLPYITPVLRIFDDAGSVVPVNIFAGGLEAR